MAQTDPYDRLHALLERLDKVLEGRGETREDVLDIERLSAATGLTKRDVGSLLRGRRPRPRDPEEYVPQRVVRLRERHEAACGKTLARMVDDLTAGGRMKEAWARLLLQGQRMPSVPHLTVLADHFGVEVVYFTDPGPVALARELRPIVEGLEPDTFEELMRRFEIREVHARAGGPLTEQQKRTIAGLIEVVLSQGKGTRS